MVPCLSSLKLVVAIINYCSSSELVYFIAEPPKGILAVVDAKGTKKKKKKFQKSVEVCHVLLN